MGFSTIGKNGSNGISTIEKNGPNGIFYHWLERFHWDFLYQASSISGTSATCETFYDSLWHLKGVQKQRN